jgi:hypothetical protein
VDRFRTLATARAIHETNPGRSHRALNMAAECRSQSMNNIDADNRFLKIPDYARRMRVSYLHDAQPDATPLQPLTVRRSRTRQLTWLVALGFALLAARIVVVGF